jgi:RNA polymerase subunit RPABC4/transcription elongation factor Spt4
MLPQKRLEQALIILLQPEMFKICEGCDSIVTLKTVICPSCKAYKFNENLDDIIEHTKEISVREQRSVTDKDLFE